MDKQTRERPRGWGMQPLYLTTGYNQYLRKQCTHVNVQTAAGYRIITASQGMFNGALCLYLFLVGSQCMFILGFNLLFFLLFYSGLPVHHFFHCIKMGFSNMMRSSVLKWATTN